MQEAAPAVPGAPSAQEMEGPRRAERRVAPRDLPRLADQPRADDARAPRCGCFLGAASWKARVRSAAVPDGLTSSLLLADAWALLLYHLGPAAWPTTIQDLDLWCQAFVPLPLCKRLSFRAAMQLVRCLTTSGCFPLLPDPLLTCAPLCRGHCVSGSFWLWVGGQGLQQAGGQFDA